MDLSQASSILQKIVPLAVIGGLFADWLRLRFARRAEARKQIARAISNLLELRYSVLILHELPKHFTELIPNELKGKIPEDIWRLIDLTAFVPVDEELHKNYRAAVEEIAGFRPVLAFQLRGKERYFDLRKMLAQHLSSEPGSPVIASRITEMLDNETIPILDQTLFALAKSHGLLMRISIKRALRRGKSEENMLPPRMQYIIHEQMLQSFTAETAKKSPPPS